MTDDLKAPERSMSMYLSVEDMLRDRIATLEAALADMTQQRDAAMAGAVLDKNGDLIGSRLEHTFRTEWRKIAKHHGLPSDGVVEADIVRAVLSALTPDPDRLLALTAAAEPVCYLPTKTVEWLDTYDGPACAKMTAVHNRPIKTDGGVPVYRIPANAIAALSRIEAQAEARGMRKAADIAGDVAITVDPTEWPIAARQAHVARKDILASADATEAAAKGGV